MSYKMKYTGKSKSNFPFKSSPVKQHGAAALAGSMVGKAMEKWRNRGQGGEGGGGGAIPHGDEAHTGGGGGGGIVGGAIGTQAQGGGGGGGAQGGGNWFQRTFSDIRLKENIIKMGKSQSGIPIYEFNYICNNDTYRGAMAQDLLSIGYQQAVSLDESGYYMVDYNKIDVDMVLV